MIFDVCKADEKEIHLSGHESRQGNYTYSKTSFFKMNCT